MNVDVPSTRPTMTSSRCKACWLKVCLQKFVIDCDTRLTITQNFAPKLKFEPNVSLITGLFSMKIQVFKVVFVFQLIQTHAQRLRV